VTELLPGLGAQDLFEEHRRWGERVARRIAQISPRRDRDPERPLRIIVGAAAGGGTDGVARIVGAELSKVLGQPVIVENRPGASTMLASEAVARSAGDGYTFLAVFGAFAVNKSLYAKRPYNDGDLTAVSILGRYPMVMVANKTLPRTVGGLVDYARANPLAVTFATGGDGTLAHLAAELLMLSSGVKLNHIPYKGGNTALPDLIAGRVGITFDTISTLGPQVRADKLNALAVTGHQRSPLLPEVPTFAESGHPLVTAYAWTAMLAQAKTPPAIVERVSGEIATLFKRPDMISTLGGGNYGMELVGGTPAQANQFIEAEEKLWADVIRKANIKTQ